jgi:hypothetical protein
MAKRTPKAKRAPTTKRHKRTKAKVVKHRAAKPATPTTWPPKPPTTRMRARRSPGAAATAAAAGQFQTVQVVDVAADEVDALIAEERATADVVSATPHQQADGRFTVVFVYRRS